ncbi:MAG: hypothetical protein GX144_14160 [Clostridiaceae bacterium]|jgi:cell wall-associated NlpC family hydrolase|nr:hypothetical protein [Clostridiaceae bacterium]
MLKWMKNTSLATGVVVLGIMMSTVGHALPVNGLNSASDWARVEIVNAHENGLLTDKLQGNFKNNITREDFCELVVKLYEELSDKAAPVEDNSPFWDTNNRKVIAAYRLGIVNGTGKGRFSPNSTATREEVSVMLYRTLQAANKNINISANNQSRFSDHNVISDWAQEAVTALRALEVIDGIGGNQFYPKGTTSREQAIILVKRMFKGFSDDYVETDWDPGVLVSRGDERNNQIEQLKKLIPLEMGKPYQWGGTGPNSYDCSGLVYTLYGKLGISLPRVSAAQSTAGTYIPRKDLQYGDLVFFARDGKNVNHVGIYVGNGQFVHAPSTGDVVKTSSLVTGYYDRCYYTARRVIK